MGRLMPVHSSALLLSPLGIGRPPVCGRESHDGNILGSHCSDFPVFFKVGILLYRQVKVLSGIVFTTNISKVPFCFTGE